MRVVATETTEEGQLRRAANADAVRLHRERQTPEESQLRNYYYYVSESNAMSTL